MLFAAIATTASAHLERPSYWPDPAPDTSVIPPAGGAVPKAKSLTSAVEGEDRGRVRVVCQGRRGKKSLKRGLQLDPQGAQKSASSCGRASRPSSYTLKQARRLRRINAKLAKKCRYKSIQAAVNRSRNNDRIVIMPGIYTEPKSRAKPLNDPKCNPSMLQKDASGSPTPSYEYQASCPNDQNLVHVQGRAVIGTPPASPLHEPPGHPQAGARPVHPLQPPDRGLGPQARPT